MLIDYKYYGAILRSEMEQNDLFRWLICHTASVCILLISEITNSTVTNVLAFSLLLNMRTANEIAGLVLTVFTALSFLGGATLAFVSAYEKWQALKKKTKRAKRINRNKLPFLL